MPQADTKLSPPSSVSAVWLLAVMQVNALLKGKRVIFLFVLLAVPLFISAVLKAESNDPAQNFGMMAPSAFLVFLLPLIGLFHGTSALAEEVDQKTLGYLLLRPLPREQIVLGKFLGAWFATVFIIGFSVVSCHIVVAWRGRFDLLMDSDILRPLFVFLVVMALGAAIYVAFSLYLSVKVKRPIFFGLFYIVVVEICLPLIPGPISNLAMSTHLQRLLPHSYRSGEAMVAEGAGLVLPSSDPWVSGAVLFLVFGLVASMAILRFRKYDLSYGSN